MGGRLRFGPWRSRGACCRTPCPTQRRCATRYVDPSRLIPEVEFYLEPLPQLQPRPERLARLRGEALDPHRTPLPEQLPDLLLRQLETGHRLPDREPAALAVAAAAVGLRGLDDLAGFAQGATTQARGLRAAALPALSFAPGLPRRRRGDLLGRERGILGNLRDELAKALRKLAICASFWTIMARIGGCTRPMVQSTRLCTV